MRIPNDPPPELRPAPLASDLRQIKDQDLLARVSAAAAAEKNLAHEVLLYLREIDRRRLYAGFGYASTYEFAVKHLHYGEGEAYRRISAMRLLREVPEAESALKEGKLSLSNASTVYGFLRNERKASKIYSRSDRVQLVRSVQGLSRRECEKALAKISPSAFPKEHERVLSAEETQISFVANAALMAQLERIRGLLSHKMQGRAGYAELIAWMAQACLRQLDPSIRSDSAAVPEERAEACPDHGLEPKPEALLGQRDATSPERRKEPEEPVRHQDRKTSRAIPAEIRRLVWKRAGGRCEYVNKPTGLRCRSFYFLEIDHIYPHALGGPSSLENLRLVCRNHNQWLAIRAFGMKKMEEMTKTKPP